jgi:hypothetical protein
MSAQIGTLSSGGIVEKSALRGVDRWIYPAMALLFLATALVGFIPSSIERIAAVKAGLRPPLSPVLHAHAVIMGSWLVLLFAQTSLAASGRIVLHRTLGMISFVLAPAVLLVMALQTHSAWTQLASLPPAAMDPAIAAAKTFVANILLEQTRSVVLFAVCIGWAIAVRRTDLETHKRMMIFGTLMPLSAGIDRIAERWLPTNFPATGYEAEYAYLLLWLAPVIVYDVLRRRRLHRAYVIGLLCLLPFAIATHLLWNSPRWQALAPVIMGVPEW